MPDPSTPVASHLDRNIEALIARRREEERRASLEDRIAARITSFAGSMTFVYLHAIIFGLWILINLGLVPLLPAFDPSLVILAMVASVEAIFISTFVLISQNRMTKSADKRADLNLQISLLAEHEATRMLTLLVTIAGKLDIDLSHDTEIHELTEDVVPEQVLDTIERKRDTEEKDAT
ncbi:DUF1003 domain-containing protein [Rhizobium paknamense]|uniref:Membrane protein n=1 Tax=Rhizobium paknamense TaxID=1206817 RepID=A0ABU0I8P0_9HYPH|nr:DUF1003 domain-containing protein [Rhizobium paknamense]MDQ0454601.1 putative membrane protein [Rhizobium paknamense]